MAEILQGIPNESSGKIKEVILFPNPGSSFIEIRTALKDVQLALYHVTGKCVLKKKIAMRQDRADVSALVPGIYFYRFSDQSRIIDSGKWIKL